MPILLGHKSTNFTLKHTNVIVDKFQEKKSLFIQKYILKELVNRKQINYVINDIIVNKGFHMVKQTEEYIVFTNSNNTAKSKTIYYFWEKTLEVEKITIEFLYFI